MAEFIKHKPYFKLSFYDKDFKYFQIETLIFLGKKYPLEGNIPDELDQVDGDFLYFQDVYSFVKNENLNNYDKNLVDVDIFTFSKLDAEKIILDFNQLTQKLKSMAIWAE